MAVLLIYKNDARPFSRFGDKVSNPQTLQMRPDSAHAYTKASGQTDSTQQTALLHKSARRHDIEGSCSLDA